MTSLADVIAGPAGPYLAIALMAAATYLCRIAGVVLMHGVRVTPRVERGLQALPGSIVVATVLPIGVQGGPVALASLGVALAVMAWSRYEIAALGAGLAVATVARAAGF